MTQLQQQATTNPNLTFWDMITGDISGTITVGLLLIAYILYALAIIIFCFFYTLYGTVLYVTGPLVLALMPVSGIGQLGKTYAINLMIWNAWGILYSVFGALITAIHFNQVNNVLGNGFLGFLQGVPDSAMLGLVSIFYALAIAMVPFIAKGIISGDVGSTAFALVRAAATAAGAALAAVGGFAAGAAAGAAATPAAAGASAGGGSSTMAMSSSMPPPTPATSMAGFLQSGMSSAMSSNSSPVTPVVGGTMNGSSGNQSGTRQAAVSQAKSGYIYSPRSVTQAVTFNIARAVGRAAGRQKPEDN
jgi:type IV secretory pathway TrbL component